MVDDIKPGHDKLQLINDIIDTIGGISKKIYDNNKLFLPILVDYAVTIPPGSNSDALCETFITWKNNNKEFITRGLDSDQTVSAIKATEKMLNII